ncbi:hypothetical protein HDU88_007949 [Geranomyces variabilis]|nr:hypothetical protein HDU88_007949 [Geranomyces variabilis]
MGSRYSSAAVLAVVLALLLFLQVSAFPALAPNNKPATRNATAIQTASGRHASPEEIAAARVIVKNAIAKSTAANKNRLDQLRLGNKRSHKQNGTAAAAAPLFKVTDRIANAVALIAEVDAIAEHAGGALKRNATKHLHKRAGGWWMGSKEHRGTWPWGGDASYQVFRDVTDPRWAMDGAAACVPDGLTDCTKAINNAMKDGKRCGEKCNGSTTKQSILYFPPGVYLVSGTIEIFFGTQLIGDANDWPTIKAASSFVGLGVLSTDHYVGNGDGADGKDNEWYVVTANFYRQIRNFKIDITATDPGAWVAALHYQVGQATSVANVDFIASPPPTTQQGIFAENGSGGHISDLTFVGGNFGIYGGSQQFTSQRISFTNVKTAVKLIWDWGWTWKGIKVKNCEVGFQLTSDNNLHQTGSLLVMDSVFINVDTAILMFPADSAPKTGTTGITLDNVGFGNVNKGVADTAGKVYKDGKGVDTWTLGPTYTDPSTRTFTFGTETSAVVGANLRASENILGTPLMPYFERKKPQYEDVPWSGFSSVKAGGAKGDGVTDDTEVLQKVINLATSGNRVVYVDAGTYLITDTVFIPKGTRIVGESWSQLAASGPAFSDASKPRPMLKVGLPGDSGAIEMQDLLFTTHGATAGAILVEWNIKADQAGSAGMWDCHTRIGGATGTGLESAQCPAKTDGINQGCNAGSMMIHITDKASGYFENVWLWVADHDIDDPNLDDDKNGMTQCSVYVARGWLIESVSPVWLYGTASEHSVFYQYNFHKAENVLAAMIQTESPYYQPTPTPPAPFSPGIAGQYASDPDYAGCTAGTAGCDAAWAVIIRQSKDIVINGAGLYSWFTSYDQSSCVDKSNCQLALVYMERNYGGVVLRNLVTIGALTMVAVDGTEVKSVDNLSIDQHPFWSQISTLTPTTRNPPPLVHKCVPGPKTKPTFEVGRNPFLDRTSRPEDRGGFVTLVNGSPYPFQKQSQHSYQMYWSFVDQVQAGDSVANGYRFAHKGDDYAEDDAAEAYYGIQIDGSPVKQLQIIASNSDKKSHLWVQLPDLKGVGPEKAELERRSTYNQFRSVPFVLTGSESYGYFTPSSVPENWMEKIMDIIGGRKLKHVAMPGSHDAGMYRVDHGSTFGGTKGNTQTQYLNFENQMRRGSRYFDVRPVIGNKDGGYYCGHYGHTAIGWQGANGPTVAELVKDTNKFMNEHPEEVIILYLSHAYNTNDDYRDFNDSEWNDVYNILEGITARKTTLDGTVSIPDMQFWDLKGSVLIVTEGHSRTSSGIFNNKEQFHHFDDYSETPSKTKMAADQIKKLLTNRSVGSADPEKDRFHVLSWTLTEDTQVTLSPVTVLDLAMDAYDSLFWDAFHSFTPYSFPSVLLMDGVGFATTKGYGSNEQDELYRESNGEALALAIAVNLAIASKNCDIGGGSIWPGEGWMPAP